MATLTLFLHAPTAKISSERRLPSQIPFSALRARIEAITGVPSDVQRLALYSTRTDDPDARAQLIAQLVGDELTLEQAGARDFMGLKVDDPRPAALANQFSDDSAVEKYEMDDEVYAKRRGECARAML